MDGHLQRHIAELNRCNQRGGRMLSVFDLLEAGSLDLDLAAFLMARLSKGASLLVGALPGGAGKTTVMCGLLTLAPADCVLVPATPHMISQATQDGAGYCVICHEIGDGPYFAYLWGQRLREYCSLADRGCMLATNLHADTLDQARQQICHDNAVPVAHFYAFNLAVLLRVARGHQGTRHWIEEVHVSNGNAPHGKVFDTRAGLRPETSPDAGSIDPEWTAKCRGFLERNHAAGIRTIEDTRAAVLEFLTGY